MKFYVIPLDIYQINILYKVSKKFNMNYEKLIIKSKPSCVIIHLIIDSNVQRGHSGHKIGTYPLMIIFL